MSDADKTPSELAADLPADAREADEQGERADLGRAADTLRERLTGSDSGSDTRAGSLRGGVATGSDDDPDSDIINRRLAAEGRAWADKKASDAE